MVWTNGASYYVNITKKGPHKIVLSLNCYIKSKALTDELNCSTMLLPQTISGFERVRGVTGSDDAFFIVGVNNFVREKDLGIRGLSHDPVDEAPRERIAAFSTSEVEPRNLKLTRGRRLLMDGLTLDVDGPGDICTLVEVGLSIEGEISLMGLVVGGIFILT